MKLFIGMVLTAAFSNVALAQPTSFECKSKDKVYLLTYTSTSFVGTPDLKIQAFDKDSQQYQDVYPDQTKQLLETDTTVGKLVTSVAKFDATDGANKFFAFFVPSFVMQANAQSTKVSFKSQLLEGILVGNRVAHGTPNQQIRSSQELDCTGERVNF